MIVRVTINILTLLLGLTQYWYFHDVLLTVVLVVLDVVVLLMFVCPFLTS